MLNNSSKTGGMPSYTYLLALKVLLVVGFIIVVSLAIMNFFFLDQLSEPGFRQVKETAETVSNMLSDLTVNGITSGNHELIKQTVEDTVNRKNVRETGLIQISVILLPSGIYYASTNPEFRNKKASQSLLNKIQQNEQPDITSEILNYEIKNRTITVLQFLDNVLIDQDDTEKRIAVVQILYDYKKIIHKTRFTLLTMGSIIFIAFVIVILAIFGIVSSVYRKLYEGFHQISRKNFTYRIPLKTNDESGILFTGFNRMVRDLRKWNKEHRDDSSEKGHGKEGELVIAPGDHALRKTEITCLVARIPLIQDQIEEKTPEAVDEFISELLEPMEKTAKEYGGQIVKILGDKIYTFFEGINSVDNSIRSALKLAQSWEVINHERKVLNRSQYPFGIGLHSAESVAGSLVRSEYQYTFIGQAASVAEYLCACAEPEQILISSSMMDKASGAYQYQIVPDIGSKEISEKEEVLSVTPIPSEEDKYDRLKRLDNSLMDSDAYIGGHSGPNRQPSSYDSSVANMLEETLNTTPLEPLTEKTEAYTEDMDTNTDRKNDPEDQSSLWDNFDAKHDTSKT